MPLRDLLRIIEGYGMQVPVKGSFVPWRPEVVYFTSDSHPNGWHFICDTVSRERKLLSPHQQQQFIRRITRILHFQDIQRPWHVAQDEAVWPEAERVEPLFPPLALEEEEQ